MGLLTLLVTFMLRAILISEVTLHDLRSLSSLVAPMRALPKIATMLRGPSFGAYTLLAFRPSGTKLTIHFEAPEKDYKAISLDKQVEKADMVMVPKAPSAMVYLSSGGKLYAREGNLTSAIGDLNPGYQYHQSGDYLLAAPNFSPREVHIFDPYGGITKIPLPKINYLMTLDFHKGRLFVGTPRGRSLAIFVLDERGKLLAQRLVSSETGGKPVMRPRWFALMKGDQWLLWNTAGNELLAYDASLTLLKRTALGDLDAILGDQIGIEPQPGQLPPSLMASDQDQTQPKAKISFSSQGFFATGSSLVFILQSREQSSTARNSAAKGQTHLIYFDEGNLNLKKVKTWNTPNGVGYLPDQDKLLVCQSKPSFEQNKILRSFHLMNPPLTVASADEGSQGR